jgi:hypothetical protein
MRHEIAVVIVTVCRQSLLRAVRSVFSQELQCRIHLLVGVDVDLYGHGPTLRETIEREKPGHVSLTWLDPGYSTSQRHGGPHACRFGGSLRSALSFLADAQYVMYLDDDDWLAPTHCAGILGVLPGKKWAFAYSVYADGNTGHPFAVDEFESVGVGKGVYAERFGGFVRPSGLAIDKLALIHILHLWSCSPFPTGDGEDRLIFANLRGEPHGFTGKATVFYALDPKDGMHAQRCAYLASRGVAFTATTKQESVRC